MQVHALPFECHGPLFEHYVIVLREGREGVEAGAETQRQIQVLVFSRVGIHSFLGPQRRVHKVVTMGHKSLKAAEFLLPIPMALDAAR